MAMSVAHFADEFRKRPGIGQVQQRAGLAAVAVTTSDDRTTIGPRQFNDRSILFRGTETAEFEGVKESITFFAGKNAQPECDRRTRCWEDPTRDD
jgi:hypothetical protein